MHGKVYIRRGQPGWYYVDLFGWRPFEHFNHGGWVAIHLSWASRHWGTAR